MAMDTPGSSSKRKIIRNLPQDEVVIRSVKSDYWIQEWTIQEKLLTVNIIPGQRLGNQLFLVLSALGLALKHRFKLVLPRSIILYDCFDLDIPVANHITMETVVKESHNYDSKFDHKLDKILSRVKTNVTLTGYLQSWRYFQNVPRVTLKNTLTFQNDVLERAQVLIPTHSGTLRVGIHVRRWDISRKPHLVNFGYTTPSVGYFHRAMQYFKEKYTNVSFIVSTDDPEWVKTELLSRQNIGHVSCEHN
ncbi:hypothetical protein CAPTEDRAFT_187827 [Capitella teleta]|uniref:L-Fucosyltransferase n=1 Tax=Capitella teleta TaxID=283909 RepID=R7ULX7_CAPTE|nr:hypothetical protein CAPTEDRAFT_187827 [Capitella teleta]|eukprot:ELU04287.1 hypothetical protein CAPTEDRAFT_187827 [Capitella teleta]